MRATSKLVPWLGAGNQELGAAFVVSEDRHGEVRKPEKFKTKEQGFIRLRGCRKWGPDPGPGVALTYRQ